MENTVKQAFDVAALELNPTLDPRFGKAITQLKRQTPDYLGEHARESYDKGTRAFTAGLRHWAACGRYLAAARELCGYGEWIPWLDVNWGQTARQALNLIEIAKHETWLIGLAESTPAMLGNLTQSRALGVIKEVDALPLESLRELEDPSWDKLTELGIEFKAKPAPRRRKPEQLPLNFYRDKLAEAVRVITEDAPGDDDLTELDRAELLRAARVGLAGIMAALEVSE